PSPAPTPPRRPFAQDERAGDLRRNVKRPSASTFRNRKRPSATARANNSRSSGLSTGTSPQPRDSARPLGCGGGAGGVAATSGAAGVAAAGGVAGASAAYRFRLPRGGRAARPSGTAGTAAPFNLGAAADRASGGACDLPPSGNSASPRAARSASSWILAARGSPLACNIGHPLTEPRTQPSAAAPGRSSSVQLPR